MSQLFVSYSHVDSDFVERLLRRIQLAFPQLTLWHDQSPHGLIGGDNWWNAILRAIADSDVFIYVLSNESVQSLYCQAEFTEARRLQKRIITIQARDKTELTDDLDDIQFIDMKHGVDDPDALQRLTAAIYKQLGLAKKLRPLWKPATPKPRKEAPPMRRADDSTIDTPPLKRPPVEDRAILLAERALRWQIISVGVAIIFGLIGLLAFVPPLLDRIPGVEPTTNLVEVAALFLTNTVQAQIDAIGTQIVGQTQAAQSTIFALTPSNTPTPSATLTPSPDFTATAHFVETQVFSTIYAVETNVVLVTLNSPTNTPVPTATSVPTPTFTATASPTMTASPTATTDISQATAQQATVLAFAWATQTAAVNLQETYQALPVGIIRNLTGSMYSEPSVTSPIVTTVVYRTAITVLEVSPSGEWMYVRLFDGTEGWLPSFYFVTRTPEPYVPNRTPVARNADWTPVTQDFDGVTMVLVPAGSFEMGSTAAEIDAAFAMCQQAADNNAECQESWFDDELIPAAGNTQNMSAFWIDRTEVTRAQYEQCVAAGECSETPANEYSTQANQPINRVTWFQAETYCAWRDARLPTEAEWEYAARGPDGLIFPWGDEFDGERANHCDSNCGEASWAAGYNYVNEENDDGYAVTAPVGSYPNGVSWVGALDMSGNVWEWTRTLYEPYPYAADGREDDTGDRTDVLRVLRGGSFDLTSDYLRAPNRYWFNPGLGLNIIGFRCASVTLTAMPMTVRPTITLPPTAANAVINIVEVVRPGDVTAEGVSIRYTGNIVSIGGWTLSDADGNTYTFAEQRLFQNAQITLYTRVGTNTPVALYWGRDTAVFAAGDTVTLRDAQGNVQSTYRIPG
jgi:formylglycine-generating enzyme required for sulfatase activity